ncbi:MAG: hypothetical protein KAU21_10290, partial [Gammaproteobacteria bacterium]|nr:hypothetical protein [Gammaproteobacteria bacterium]
MQNKIDFQFLKRTLIFLTIVIILSVGFILQGGLFESKKFDEYTKAKSSLAGSHRKYSKLVKDIDLIYLYTQSYKDYKKSGLIGPERRLSWIETLESVNDVLKLPRLSYALEPQQEFKRPKLTIDPKIKVSSTPMELNIDLLHEEDLFAVFEGIRGNIDNLFTIDSCNISRTG